MLYVSNSAGDSHKTDVVSSFKSLAGLMALLIISIIRYFFSKKISKRQKLMLCAAILFSDDAHVLDSTNGIACQKTYTVTCD
jgi:hypothetical protein